MDDKNNLLEKLGIVAKKEEPTAKRKASHSNPRPNQAPIEKPALSNKYSSDDLAMEYEEMLKERAAMAKQIKELEARAASKPAPAVAKAPAPAPVAKTPTPEPIKTVAPKPIIEAPKAAAPEAVAAPAPEPARVVAPEVAASSYSYHDTEEFSSVAEIYATQGRELNGVNTVYVVDSFVSTLPETLTDNVKKDVLLRILSVSNIDSEELVADGEARLEILSSYAEDFKAHTKEYISSRSTEVALLEEQIKALKKEMMDRNKLQAKQQAEIAAETAKISGNMVFITKDKAENSAE